jgi:hypothetical protein
MAATNIALGVMFCERWRHVTMVLPLLGPPAVSYTTVAATKRPVSNGLTAWWPLSDISVPQSQHANPQSQHATPSPAVKMMDDVPMGSAPTDAAERTRRAGAHMALIDKPEVAAFVDPWLGVRCS